VSSRTSRREVLKKGAIATAGASVLGGGAGAAFAQVDAAEAQSAAQLALAVDVCVIGGGFAGLTAALRVRQSRPPRSVFLIEAGQRLGGRTFTNRVSDGTPFEIGGAWVSGTETQSNILQLMQELGIGMFRQFVDGDSIFVNSAGTALRWQQDQDPLPPFSDAARANLVQALAKLSLMAETISLTSPWQNIEFPFFVVPGDLTGPANSVEADHMSLQTWMDTEMLDDPDSIDAKTLLAAAVSGLSGIDPPALSLLYVVYLIKTFGSVNGLPPNLVNITGTDVGQANAFRIPQGMGSITEAMIRRIGRNSMITNSPVHEISQDARGVTILSERVRVRARQVIVAFATTNQGLIRFKPALPNDRAQLQQRYPLGLIWKNWLLYDEAFWRTNGFTGNTTSIFEDDFYGVSLDAGPAPDRSRPGLLVAFVDADKGRLFARKTRAERKQIMIDEIAHRFDAVGLGDRARQPSQPLRFPVVPPQNPFPDNYFELNWVTPEFERGDYGGAPGPGVLTAFGLGPAIRERFGRVIWAGVDTSDQCYGTINSAIQSGNRAAAAALASL
jgi:monoamine oxidase